MNNRFLDVHKVVHEMSRETWRNLKDLYFKNPQVIFQKKLSMFPL